MTKAVSVVPPRIERVTRAHQVAIAAPAERVFPLASPAGEYEWIEGWSCEMVYPPSGAMQEGCIFRERLSGPLFAGWPAGPTTWIVERYVPEALEVRFLLVFARDLLGHLAVRGTPTAAGACNLSLELTLTALDERANSRVSAAGRKARALVEYLGEGLKHYAETGAMLDRQRFLSERGLRHGARIHGLMRKLGLA